MKPELKTARAAFVGVESHFVYTRSSAFFIEILRESLGHVHAFPSEWRWIHLPLRRWWDLVVFWQHFPEPWEVDALKTGNVVLVPMYDNCPRDEGFWKQYSSCRILCFSRALGNLLRGFGLDVLTVQYYPPVPLEEADWDTPGLKAFFWPRKEEVSWAQVRPLVAPDELSGLHLHVTNNLSEVKLGITEEEEKAFHISTSTWFDSAEDYRNLLRRHQVFLAPRREEGIGLSFLEALSLGMAVIAPNNSTMNEYICSGVNGYLYDADRPAKPSLVSAQQWGREARKLSESGREEWLQSIPQMIDFLLSPRLTRDHGNAGTASQPSGFRKRDPRVARSIIRAWPGFIRYSVWKGLLAGKRILFPQWKKSAKREIQLRS